MAREREATDTTGRSTSRRPCRGRVWKVGSYEKSETMNTKTKPITITVNVPDNGNPHHVTVTVADMISAKFSL